MEHEHEHSLAELWESIEKSGSFILVSLLIMVAVILLAVLVEKALKKKVRMDSGKLPEMKDSPAKRIAGIGVFAAIGGVLTLIEIPLIAFYQLDFSEIPAMMAGFLMGPVAGILVEFIKVIVHILFHGTHSAFVGELAMFVTGSVMVLPAACFYMVNKTKKRALWSLLIGSLFFIVISAFFNAFYLIPKFADMYGVDIPALAAMVSESVPFIKGDTVWSVIAFATIPFNCIKALIVSVIVFLIYKPLSKLYRKIH